MFPCYYQETSRLTVKITSLPLNNLSCFLWLWTSHSPKPKDSEGFLFNSRNILNLRVVHISKVKNTYLIIQHFLKMLFLLWKYLLSMVCMPPNRENWLSFGSLESLKNIFVLIKRYYKNNRSKLPRLIKNECYSKLLSFSECWSFKSQNFCMLTHSLVKNLQTIQYILLYLANSETEPLNFSW